MSLTSEDLWDEFADDYIFTMPGINNRTHLQNQNAFKIYRGGCETVATNKPVLILLDEYLDAYICNAPNAEKYVEITEYLKGRIRTFMEKQT